MTHKAIRYSNHAADRLQERGIRRSDVRRALAVGTIKRAADATGVHMTWVVVRGATLEVHFKEGPTGIYIITVLFDER